MQQLDLFAVIETAKPQNDTLKAGAGLPDAALSLPEKPALHATAIAEETVTVIQHRKKIKEPKPASKRGRMSFKEMDADLVMVEVPGDEILFKKQYYAIS